MTNVTLNKNLSITESKEFKIYKLMVLITTILGILYQLYYVLDLYLNPVAALKYTGFSEGFIFYFTTTLSITTILIYITNFYYLRKNTASTLPYIIDFIPSVFFYLSGSLDTSLILIILISGIGLIYSLRFRHLNGKYCEII